MEPQKYTKVLGITEWLLQFRPPYGTSGTGCEAEAACCLKGSRIFRRFPRGCQMILSALNEWF